jgi:AmiR/NasT family two-component response regulator
LERVILAFSKDDTAQKIKRMLDGSAYDVCMICHSASELLRSAAELDDTFVIMGYKIGDRLVDDIAYDLNDIKIVAIVKPERQDMIENEAVFVIPLPVSRERLLSSIEVFLGHIEKSTRGKQRTPEEVKIIEKAKLYLMEKYMMTEDQAHRFIQKRSMDSGSKFIDTARLILRI